MKNRHRGQNFDDFLRSEGYFEEVTAVALKRVIAWQIAEQMRINNVNKSELARRMQTSRAALNRLLDETDPSLTLTTLASAAAALGSLVKIQIEPMSGVTAKA